MELIMSITTPEIMDIEKLLAEAGIDFTVVPRCPDPACEVCRTDVPAAA